MTTDLAVQGRDPGEGSDRLHVAIIMDGNGRWAEDRGLHRLLGHRAGARAARRIVEAAPDLGIGTLTLYAFSSDNWQRPVDEVAHLMRLLSRYLQAETARCVRDDVRVSVLGRRDRLPPALVEVITRIERATLGGQRLHLRLAVDYSGRDAILDAVHRLSGGVARRDDFARALAAADPTGEPAPDVDLMVRSGGEQRLSDFLLWECAYAELWFTPTRWPDFTAAHLQEALDQFRRRQRRFGGLAGEGAL
jgi:undecaprenyl diphosphate synthase